MKRSYKDVLIRCLILMVGLIIAHFGVTLYLMADLGADPFNVLIQGLFRTTQSVFSGVPITHGNVHIAVSFLIILILLVMGRTYVKIGTLLCMLCGGLIIDIFTIILTPLFSMEHPIWIDYCVEVIACVILAFGMTIVIKSDAGTGPNDLVAVVISDKLHFKFSVVRILTDLTFVAIGFLLGGALGVGTIICAFLVGPVAGFFLPYSEKYINKIVQDDKEKDERKLL